MIRISYKIVRQGTNQEIPEGKTFYRATGMVSPTSPHHKTKQTKASGLSIFKKLIGDIRPDLVGDPELGSALDEAAESDFFYGSGGRGGGMGRGIEDT